MTDMYANKRVLLAGLQSAAGTAASVTGSDAVLVNGEPSYQMAGDTVQRNYVRSYFGAPTTIRVTNYCTLEFEVDMIGGTNSPLIPLLQACRHSKLTAATIGATATATAGSSSSITLANSASVTNDFYNNWTIAIVSGTGAGQIRTVADYTGGTRVATVNTNWVTTPDNTSVYSFSVVTAANSTTVGLSTYETFNAATMIGRVIEITHGTGAGQKRIVQAWDAATNTATVSVPWSTTPNITSVYRLHAAIMVDPVTTADSDFCQTLHWREDSVRHVLLDAEGTVTIEMSARNVPVARFRFTGLKGTISEESAVSGLDFSAWKAPIPINAANTSQIGFKGISGLGLARFSLDAGVQIAYRNIPGHEKIHCTGRAARGTAVFQADPTLAVGLLEDVAANTPRAFTVRHGIDSGAAGTFNIVLPNAKIPTATYSSEDNLIMIGGDFNLEPTGSGNNEYRIAFMA